MSNRTFQSDVPIDVIICPPQIRKYFDNDAQAGLDMTVRQHGVQVPVTLYRHQGKLYLKDGARRIRAAKADGRTTIPAMIEEGGASEADVIVNQLIANCQREDLIGLEKAEAIAAVMNLTGVSATQIAAKIGFTNSTVTKLLSLLSLPDHIKERLRSGELPVTTAYELTHVKDVAEQTRLAGQVAGGELTRDGLSAVIKSRNRNPKRKQTIRRLCRITAKLEDRQSVTVAAPALDLNAMVTILEKLLACANQARSEGLAMDAFLKRLKSKPDNNPSATQAA